MSIRHFKNIIPKFGEHTYIDEQALVLGDVIMGKDCSLWPMAVLRGDVNSIRIGDRTNIQDGSVGHVTHHSEHYERGAGLIIGNDVTIGHRVIAHACTIGDRCLIGMGSVILDHAMIQDEVMIGAGSLVPENKILESGYLYLGSPVKQVRKLTAKEIEFLTYSAQHYVGLKDQYLRASKS